MGINIYIYIHIQYLYECIYVYIIYLILIYLYYFCAFWSHKLSYVFWLLILIQTIVGEAVELVLSVIVLPSSGTVLCLYFPLFLISYYFFLIIPVSYCSSCFAFALSIRDVSCENNIPRAWDPVP